MAWIRTIGDDEAGGLLKRIYEQCRQRGGKVWNIIRLSSLRPRATQASLDVYMAVMYGDSELSRAERELLAVVVSRANGCHY